MKRPEKDVLRAILDFLSLYPHDVLAWRQNTGAMKTKTSFVRFSRAGAADITGIVKGGRRLEIETKAHGRTQSPAQKEFQREIESLGGIYILAYDVDAVQKRLQAERVIP